MLVEVLARVPRAELAPVDSYADVSCGSGAVARHTAQHLRQMGFATTHAAAYDVSPHVTWLDLPGIETHHADFTGVDARFDLVTVFDVAEHVPDPTAFLSEVAARARWVAAHLPLEDHLNWNLRDRHRPRMKDPGHLLVLDFAAALNLVSQSGLQVVDYAYTRGFEAPSGHESRIARALLPARRALARRSPWLVSKLLGGMSLMVLARGKLERSS